LTPPVAAAAADDDECSSLIIAPASTEARTITQIEISKEVYSTMII
jgi:hypothetical protein